MKEKKASKGRGRPEFLYRPADIPQPETAPKPSVVALEFSKLKKACRYEKGGYCKLARDVEEFKNKATRSYIERLTAAGKRIRRD